MKRLKPGEYTLMTPEQKAEHRKTLRKAWEKIPKNKKKVLKYNRAYQKRHWLVVASSFFERECKICGKKVLLKARRTICDECRGTESANKKRAEAEERRQKRLSLRNLILEIAKNNPDMPQSKIGELAGGIPQARVSYTLRTAGLRRRKYAIRNNNDK